MTDATVGRLRLLLDEHYSEDICRRLREAGYDVVAVVSDPALRSRPDADLFRLAAAERRRIVTENVKDFRPLQASAYAEGGPVAQLLLVSASRFPRGSGARTESIVTALLHWLEAAERDDRADEDWLV